MTAASFWLAVCAIGTGCAAIWVQGKRCVAIINRQVNKVVPFGDTLIFALAATALFVASHGLR